MNYAQKTILVVDDEPDIREIICFNLEQTGYCCIQADCGQSALQILKSQAIDMLLLDIMMPDISGIEVAKHVVMSPHPPAIIFLTALDNETDILRGFELGADDYIAKPFSLKQLLARVGAVLRRYSTEEIPHESADTIQYESLVLYKSLKTATLNGRPISLTRMEYELLLFLLQHPQNVYSRAALLQRVWPDDGLVLERTVDVTVNRLRKKLGEYRDHLKAKTGYGYFWEQ